MKSTIYTTIGASNHFDTTREEHDFYATFPEAIDRLFEVEKFPDTIWEPACGMGAPVQKDDRIRQGGLFH